jgi:hypothetical protein
MCWALVASQPAGAAAAWVRTGTEATGSGTTITPSFSSASTAGRLLVAVIGDINGNCTTDNITAPSGWVKAAHSCRGSAGPIELWYYPNAPATTSVTFNTGNSGSNTRAVLSEWSGVATSSPLDRTGTANNTTGSTSPSVSTTGTISGSGEAAITGFLTASGLSTFTAGSGWSTIVHDPGNGFDSDRLTSPTVGSTLTETATSNATTTWGAVIATFKPPCVAGSLTITVPTSIAMSTVTLNASNQTSSGSLLLTPDDERNSPTGWNITGTSTTFTAGTHTLSTTATNVSSASSAAATGNCTLPTNSIAFPVTLPAAGTGPAAVKLYNAASATGTGPTNVTLNFQTSIPANSFNGSYTSTWTIAIVSGP